MKSHGNKDHDDFFDQFVAAVRRRCPIVFKEDDKVENEYVQAQMELGATGEVEKVVKGIRHRV